MYFKLNIYLANEHPFMKQKHRHITSDIPHKYIFNSFFLIINQLSCRKMSRKSIKIRNHIKICFKIKISFLFQIKTVFLFAPAPKDQHFYLLNKNSWCFSYDFHQKLLPTQTQTLKLLLNNANKTKKSENWLFFQQSTVQ